MLLMALSLFLQNAGIQAESIETEAQIFFEKVNDAWTITKSHLVTQVKAPGLDQTKLAEKEIGGQGKVSDIESLER